MAHKTLIEGTAYEISGGKTLVDGTAYTITGGKTLVEGTEYAVGIGDEKPAVPTAMLYSDGTLVFQLGDAVDSGHGELVASYTGFDTDTYYDSNRPPWLEHAEDITEVRGNNSIAPLDTGYWFFGCRNLNRVNLGFLRTGNVTRMYGMFAYCENLVDIDVSYFRTENVTVMSNMFYGCKKLTTLDLRKFNTEKVVNFYSMFGGCSELTSLNVGSLNTANATGMYGMFSGCEKLTKLDLSSFDTSKVTNMTNMFYGCKSLATIYVSDTWNTEAVSSSDDMFYGCVSLVGDIPFDSAYTDKTYATKVGGYLIVGETAEITITGDPMVKLTSACVGKIDGLSVSGTCDGVRPYIKGTVITLEVGADEGYQGEVVLNGETVFVCEGAVYIFVTRSPYDYIVSRDATIEIIETGNSTDKNRQGKIIITER